MRFAAVAALIAAAVVAMPATNVQVGYCTSLGNADAAKTAGFDYVEVSATEVAALSDADFDAAAAHLKQAGIATPTANLFVPQTIKVVGPDINLEQQTAHVSKVMTRLSRLGVEVLVFGSGGARRVPDGFDRDKAWTQLVDFSRRAADAASRYRITVTIEPLRRQETNIVNTAAEGLELVKAVNHPNFQLMIDFYHLASEHEDPAVVLKAKDHLRHLHVANPNGRVFPQTWSEFDYAPFFANLKAIGYDKRISMEGSTTDLAAQGPVTVALLRRAFE
ncbi:MAG TPA: sugar phosphate isomerase/epimerase family protein [Vicinamibacterales bacterium]|jgi:sugar phosphate isomerase/epimerase